MCNISCRYMTKKVAAERFGIHATHTVNADSRAEASKGGRGGDEEHGRGADDVFHGVSCGLMFGGVGQ